MIFIPASKNSVLNEVIPIRYLNQDSLCDLLLACYSNQGYRAAIAFLANSKAVNFAKAFTALHQKTPIAGVDKISIPKTASNTAPSILFKNGSRIQLVPVSSKSCGRCYHQILYDEEAFSPPESIKANKTALSSSKTKEASEENTAALDSFLGSFRITNNPTKRHTA